MSTEIDKIVTFHFVSGKKLVVGFSNDKFEENNRCLKSGWNTAGCIGDKFGINFSLVTHYEVKD